MLHYFSHFNITPFTTAAPFLRLLKIMKTKFRSSTDMHTLTYIETDTFDTETYLKEKWGKNCSDCKLN